MARIYRFQEFEFDASRRELRYAGQKLPLEPKAFEILEYLIRYRERVVPAEELLSVAWSATTVERGSLHRVIRLIRSTLDPHFQSGSAIATSRGRGYRFAIEVESGDLAPTSAPHPIFVGRESILAELAARLDRAIAGSAQVALIHGPPGIGKSTLLEQVAGIAERAGACFVEGRCIEGPAAPPFRPWSRVLRGFARQRGTPELVRSLHHGAAEITRAFPGLGIEQAGDTPATNGTPSSRYRLYDAVGEWLRRASRGQPLVIAFDDLHRADADSLQLLEFILDELSDERVLIVAAQRELAAEPGSAADALDRIARRRSKEMIGLGELNREEVTRFLKLRTGETPSPQDVASALDRSGGNPLFLEQMAALGRLSGSSENGGPADIALRAALGRLIEDASSDCRELVSLAAVLGRECNVRVLEAGLGIDSLSLQRSLREARARRVFDPAEKQASRARFLHGLIPEVLHAALSEDERIEQHRRAYVGLSTAHPGSREHLGEMAHHAAEASPLLGARLAFDCGVSAGREALRRLAYENAIERFDRALAVVGPDAPEPASRVECLIEVGRAALVIGRSDQASERLGRACDLARELGDSQLFARAALGWAGCQDDVEHPPQEVALLEEALELLGDGAPELRVRLLAELSEAVYFDDMERSLETGREAAEIARRLDDPATLAAALFASGLALGWTDRAEERTAQCEEALAIAAAEPVGEMLTGRIMRVSVEDPLASANRSLLDARINAFERYAKARRLSFFEWSVASHRASVAAMEGRYEQARAMIAENGRIGQRLAPAAAMAVAGAQATWMEVDLRNFEAVAAMMKPLIERFPERSSWRATLAMALAELGDHEQARYHLGALVDTDFAPRRRDVIGITLGNAAEAVLALGDRETANLVAGALDTIRDRYLTVGMALITMGATDRYRGMCAEVLEDLDQAIVYYESAIGVDEGMRARPRLARGHYDLARVLAKRGRDEDRFAGRRHRATAHEMATELGNSRLVSLCEPARREGARA